MHSSLASRLINMIKRCMTTQAMQDTKSFPIVQVTYYNRAATVEVLTPYGMSSSPPKGSLGNIFAMGGNESDLVGFFNSPQTRFRNLQEGEVAVGNPVTGAKIYFKADGSVELDVPNGQLTINAPQGMVINAGPQFQVNSVLSNFTGPVQSEADITDNVGGTDPRSMASMRTIYDSHTHLEHGTGNQTSVPTEQE